MNALEAASLVMIPSGYENGTLGSLKPLDGTGDFTFSRGSDISATRVNEDGYIEKGYENLLLQSNTFSDAAWTNSGTSVTSGQSGYDGSNDAWILETASNGSRYIQKLVSINSVQSISVYAKAGTANFLGINIVGTGGGYSFFNLSNGTLGSSSSVVIDKSIELVNGTTDWYRCSFVINANTTAIRIYPTNADNNFASTTGQNIYIQDAMLNQGMVSYPYVETTTAPVAGGILEDMPRLDYTDSSCPALLLEPQRNNLVSYSEYFEGNQLFSNLTAQYNSIISPEGLLNATKITAIDSGRHEFGDYPNVSSGVDIVGSVFVKADTTEYVQFYFGGGPASGSPYANFFIGDNPSVEREVDLTASIEDYGNGWLRLIIKQTTDASGIIAFAVMPIPNGTIGRAGSYTANGESIFTYGLQLEQDATYPTSYIPTYGTSQTRLADSCVDAGDASTFNDSEGVLYTEIATLANDGTRSITLSNGGNNNRILISYNPNGRLDVNLTSDGVFQAIFNYSGVANPSEMNKIAFKYKQNDFALWVNGVEVGTDSSGITPIGLDKLNFSTTNAAADFFFANVKQVLYFPTALSDDECIELTTI